jgi:cardiolipin synthase (CMP-forming)
VTDKRPRDRILTIPNLVTFVRLAGVVAFWWFLLGDRIVLAAWFVFIIGWSDWLDGYLARKLNQASKLGAILDPVADRLMIFSAVVGGLIVGIIPPVIGIALVAREVLMAVVAGVLYLRGHGVLEVRYAGKLATFILYGAIPAFYLAAAGVMASVLETVGWVTGVVGLILYWYVAFLYIGDARSAMSGLESADPVGREV